ncbi:MAG: ribbon-helix-helix protein, CopG family [Bryobacteraceae bacterium]
MTARTIVALDKDIKDWLDERAAKEGVPMTELVRRAVRAMKEQEQSAFDKLLKDTSGIWKQGDGLEYQDKIRSEWDGPAD